MLPMENWLKETVPGIILLGAIGSVFAVAILKLFTFLSRRYFLKIARYFVLHQVKYALRENYLLGFLSGQNDISKIAVYILRQLYLFIIFFFGGIASLLVLLFNASQVGSAYLSSINIIAMTILIICMYRTVKVCWTILVTYSVHVYPGFVAKKDDQQASALDNPET